MLNLHVRPKSPVYDEVMSGHGLGRISDDATHGNTTGTAIGTAEWEKEWTEK
jgi:hypothetical protein